MVEQRPQIRGAVLAGGAASRFGGKPKGLERVGGERILDTVVRNVQAATSSLPTIIANAEEAPGWLRGLKVVKDVVPDCGTLSGLHAAITHDEGPVVVVAWDMPFITTELLEALIRGANGYDAYVPESKGPQGVEPLCAVYQPTCGPVIRQFLVDEDYRATGFLDAVNTGRMPLSEVERFGDPERLFFNVNTPTELKVAEDLWRSQHG
jgi:molybdopterin-guanine dinucleotide biosynthesis protein A